MFFSLFNDIALHQKVYICVHPIIFVAYGIIVYQLNESRRYLFCTMPDDSGIDEMREKFSGDENIKKYHMRIAAAVKDLSLDRLKMIGPKILHLVNDVNNNHNVNLAELVDSIMMDDIPKTL